jgi:tetratricopeptide (TPR) repeat protein
MLKRIIFITILCLFVGPSSSWSINVLVPFQGALKPGDKKQFLKIQDACRSGHGDAVDLARLFYHKNASLDDDVEAWSLLVYTQVLLDNDGVQQAKELLGDSMLVNWNQSASWVRAYRNINLGIVRTYEGNYAQAKSHFEKASQLSEIAEILELNLLLAESLAEKSRYRGKFDESLNKWYEALQLAESSADSFSIADVQIGMGVVRYLRGEMNLAEENVNLAYAFYVRKGTKKKIASCLSLKGLLAHQSGDFQNSIEKNLEAYNLRKEAFDLKGQGESLNNLALAYMGMKNWKQALSYLEKAVQFKIQAKDLTQMAVIFNNMGHCHAQLGNSGKALDYFQLALKKAQENGQIRDVINAYEDIISVHQKNRDYEEGFKAQKKLIGLKDSLSNVQRSLAVNELELKYETQKRGLETLSLQQQQAIITNRWLTLAVGLFLTIIIGILFVDNQKRKHRQQTELLTKQDELKKAELRIVTDLLEYNQKKLNLYTNNLLMKNELVSQLEEKLRGSSNGKTEMGETDQKLIRDFSVVRILTDEDWEEFKDLFNSVHAGMLDRLLSSYENLSLAEQRLFLLMKLELSTKEIANILGVSPDSVKKGRYRLKKKIGIEDATSLQVFVTSF